MKMVANKKFPDIEKRIGNCKIRITNIHEINTSAPPSVYGDLCIIGYTGKKETRHRFEPKWHLRMREWFREEKIDEQLCEYGLGNINLSADDAIDIIYNTITQKYQDCVIGKEEIEDVLNPKLKEYKR